ncbi:hypothetical protein EWM64_g5454 [Hericium alpestre]|uniref:Major facilitator superfamily (MFS) profile domain-containing protein n=1 Tax=Hericium alpestre TaxID=135208 RepID=A0A4Y9ZWX2_9AGAM|nr:hypothetical protein EWM64_g5454 [Hericium alpestre]
MESKSDFAAKVAVVPGFDGSSVHTVPTSPGEGLVVHGSPDDASVSSTVIDPRIGPLAPPSSEVLDEGYVQQLSDIVHHKEHHHVTDLEKVLGKHEILYVEFEKHDKRDPVNFSKAIKWGITLSACFFTMLSATSSSSYALGFDTMTRDLNCTEFQATIGLSVYPLGFGIVPLLTASLSEEFGRRYLYLVSAFGFMMFQLMTALSGNIQTVILARFLAGAFGSTGSTMVGGSIADIWQPHERGLPMAIFSLVALGGTAVGPIAAGWIDMNPHMGWRWIQWIHVIFTGMDMLALCLIGKETRKTVILTRLAWKLRKETGNHRYRARAEDESASLKTLVFISMTRPIYLLLTEPIVIAFSIWVGFAWGILYVLMESISPIFRDVYRFNTGETGTVFVAVLLGTIFGYLGNMHQERLYQKYFAKRGPEARLFWVCIAGVTFPAGMFIYAWTAYSRITWVAPCIGIVIVIFSIFLIYLAVFTYLADW